MKEETGPIGELGPSDTIQVVGAGVSGLLISYYLKKAGYKVVLYEGRSVGGKVGTLKTACGLVETAANAVYTNADVMELLQELNLSPQFPATKLKKKLWRKGKARSFPYLIRELPALAAGLMKRIPADLEDVSVYDFFRPMMGDQACYEIVSAVLGGVYAADAKELRFKSVFKQDIGSKTYAGFMRETVRAKRQSGHKAASVSFRGGMGEFIKALEGELKENIVKEEKGFVEAGVNTVVCADAAGAAKLLDPGFPKVAEQLRQIEYRQLSTTTCFLKRPVSELENSFGILFAPNSGFSSLGVLHNSAIFRNRTFQAGIGSYTFISQSGRQGEAQILGDLSRLEGESFGAEDIVELKQTAWTRAIPMYNNRRHRAVTELRGLLKGCPGLVLFGNYADGVSIREMVSAAKNFAASQKAQSRKA